MKTESEIKNLIEHYENNQHYEEGYTPDGYDEHYYSGMIDALELVLDEKVFISVDDVV